jgi:hypothetical protein
MGLIYYYISVFVGNIHKYFLFKKEKTTKKIHFHLIRNIE